MSIAYIALGSNIGDARVHFDGAAQRLSDHGNVLKRSRLYRTKPWGFAEQADFTNAALMLETALSPAALMQALQDVEGQLGKVVVRENGPRTLDLDILFYDDVCLDAEGLVIPHPRAHERDFVLMPMCDIAPDWMHPSLQQTMCSLLEALSTKTFTGAVEDW